MTSKLHHLFRCCVSVHKETIRLTRKKILPESLQVSRYCTTAHQHNVGAGEEAPAEVDTVSPLISGLSQPVPLSASCARQAWVESVDSVEGRKVGLVELHPEVFAAFPKLHLIHDNIRWQTLYARVDHAVAKTRAEVRGGGRKPWPQKGTGRARHGSIRSPLWRGGGVAHGPRGPKTYFYMLPYSARVGGLCATLSAKLAQGDLRVVQHLHLPSPEPGFLQQMADHRLWGPSVLFVDDTDKMPESIAAAASKIAHFNLMPVYGLNVYSMLKHDTLVLTSAGLERIQERLLHALTLPDAIVPRHTDASLMQ